MANKQKPDNVHLLKGTYRKDRHGDKSKKPKVDSKFPTQPQWLTANAKKEWQRVKKVMENSGVITQADSTVLSQYCLLVSDMQELKEGFQAAKHTQLRQCAAELGLTPVARSKITVKSDDDDEF